MPDASLKSTFNRPPEAAQKYLQGKGYAITESWRDLPAEAHARAFTVARAARLEVLQSIREELQRAMDDGLPFADFQKNLKPRLQALGWWGKAIDTQTGEITPYPGTGRPIELGSPRRLETIYRTNLQTAYMAGRWKRFEAESRRAPFIQYIAVADDRTRPSHLALHQRVFRIDDPAWDKIAPPNGFNCRCRVRNLSQKELDARGLDVSNSEGYLKEVTQPDRHGNPVMRSVLKLPGMDRAFSPDVGWDYNPGRATSRWDKAGLVPECGLSLGDQCLPLAGKQKTYKDYGRPALQDVPRELLLKSPGKLGQAATREEALRMLAGALDVSDTAPVNEVITPIERVIVRYDMLGHLVADPAARRERFANFLLPTLKDPYEVWLSLYNDGSYRHRYIGMFEDDNILVIARINTDGSLVYNAMPAKHGYLNNSQRKGTLAYGK